MAITQIKGGQVLDATITEADLAASVAGDGISGGAGSALALDINELTAATVDVAADSIAIVDADDANSSRKEAIADIISATAGDGLAATSGVLALDLNELTAATVDVAADSIAIVDASDSNSSRQESVADLVSGVAGSGLTATSGVLSVEATTSNLTDLAVTDDGVTAGSPQTVSVAAGTVRSDNSVNSFAGTSGLSVTTSATNFIEYDFGTNSVSANTSGFTAGSLPLATVVVDAAPDITSVTDQRAWLDVELGASGLTDADFVIREVPTGDLDGVDTTYVLANTPTAGTEEVYLNGILQNEGASNDYTISGATITFANAPVSTDVVLVSYRK